MTLDYGEIGKRIARRRKELGLKQSEVEEKADLNLINENIFKERIANYEKYIQNLLIAVILLTYYGGNQYINLIKKIVFKTYPIGTVSGNTAAIDLLYYPTLLIVYSILISSLESNNCEVMKEIIELKDNKIEGSRYYRDSEYLLCNLFYKINNISSDFKLFFPDQNYKYPMNEYLYKLFQPIIDDLLFVGDDYSERFTNAELLISLAYAIENYTGKDYVWGPAGRYLYILGYGDKDISKLPINGLIEKIGLYDKVDNKEEFLKKYSSFLSKHYF